MQRSKSVPVLVLVAVIALVLGSFGTATAAGLTAKSVKKIATKVVNKKAKTLTVANATNATNATNLAGQPASAFQDISNVYLTTVTPATDTFDIIIPLTAGKTYEVSYSAYLSGGSDAACYVYVFNDASLDTVFYTADDGGDATSSPSHSGVGVVTPAAGQTTHLFCGSSTNFTTISAEPIQIVVTPLDATTSATLSYTTKPGVRP
jgi:hypothetical protein